MRYFGSTVETDRGGTRLDDLADPGPDLAWLVPAEFVPVDTAQYDASTTNTDRNRQVTGGRARRAPNSFAARPRVTATSVAHPKFMKHVILHAFSGTITSDARTVDPDEVVTSAIVPTLRGGTLRTEQLTILREEQLDRVSGAAISEFNANFPIDGEGTVDVTWAGLFGLTDPSAGVDARYIPRPTFLGYDSAFTLRDGTAYIGAGAGVAIDCISGVGFTWNNNLVDDMRVTHCAGRNVFVRVLDAIRHKLWFPNRHRVGPQDATLRLDFGSTRPDQELRRTLAHADKIVCEFAADPLGTTPDADEMMRVTFLKGVATDGQAEALTQDDEQMSSYTYSAFLDEATGGDVIVEFTGRTELGA